MKVIVGCEGLNAEPLAKTLKMAWPLTARQAYEKALDIPFGCIACLVVMTESDVVCNNRKDIHPRFRQTFQKPDFNPRWERGTADHIVVTEV